MYDGTPIITRGDLAKALDEVVRDDDRLAGALALSEAWDPGYIASVLIRAESLITHGFGSDHGSADVAERSTAAVREAIAADDPRRRVERTGAIPTPAAIAALHTMLASRAYFHETTDELERRNLRRLRPPK